jgi:hypothetical protein
MHGRGVREIMAVQEGQHFRMSPEERNFVEGVLPVLMQKDRHVIQVSDYPKDAASLMLRVAKHEGKDKKFFIYCSTLWFARETKKELITASATILLGSRVAVNQTKRLVLILEDSHAATIEFEFTHLSSDTGIRGLDFDIFVFVHLPEMFRSRAQELLDTCGL